MADEAATGMSKSAKRRAAKKARDEAAGEAEAPAPAPAAPPAAKEPAAAEGSKAKSKAKAKAEPAPPPPPAAAPKPAEPKAKAEGKAKAKAKAEAAAPPAEAAKPKAEAAKPKAESKQKAKAKAKAAPAPVEEPPKKKEPEVDPFISFDDGTGGDWEVATAVSKKEQNRRQRKDEEKKFVADIKQAQKAALIPGMAPGGQTIPGMAPAGKSGAGGVSQLVTETSAAAQAAAAAVAAAAEESASGKADLVTATVKVPEARIGIVIGPKGAKIKQIQEKTGVTRIDTSGELFTITGKAAEVAEAKKAVEDLVEKGYTALAYENFSENHVMVHPSHFPDIIGKQGAIIRKLKEELGVEVSIPPTPKTGNFNASPKKYKVTIAGSREGVEKAKEVLNDIVSYYHHEITHPGEVHEEIEVEEWQYPFIIGKGGCEMRHVQKSYHVRMYIPRETSTNKNVVIIGDKGSCERAKTYVQRQLDNSWTASRGRDRNEPQGDDGWGDDGGEEDWMKAYMYKR